MAAWLGIPEDTVRVDLQAPRKPMEPYSLLWAFPQGLVSPDHTWIRPPTARHTQVTCLKRDLALSLSHMTQTHVH